MDPLLVDEFVKAVIHLRLYSRKEEQLKTNLVSWYSFCMCQWLETEKNDQSLVLKSVAKQVPWLPVEGETREDVDSALLRGHSHTLLETAPPCPRSLNTGTGVALRWQDLKE